MKTQLLVFECDKCKSVEELLVTKPLYKIPKCFDCDVDYSKIVNKKRSKNK